MHVSRGTDQFELTIWIFIENFVGLVQRITMDGNLKFSTHMRVISGVSERPFSEYDFAKLLYGS